NREAGLQDLEDAATHLSLRRPERRPDTFGVGLHARFELQLDDAAADHMQRVLMEERRGNEKHGIRVAHRLDVEMGQEIVQVLIAHQGGLHPEIDLENSRAAMEAQVFCGLELHGEAFSDVSPYMDFEVTAVIVRKRPRWDEPPVRSQDCDLGELGLGDDTLL